MMRFLNRMIVTVLPVVPKSLIWLFSRRYIAGVHLDDALRKTRLLNQEGAETTIDVLGEEIHDLDEAKQDRRQCEKVLKAISVEKLKAGLSLKLTALGLRQDPEVCFRNVREIVSLADSLGLFVRIDMEDSTTTQSTLDIYRRLRKEFKNVGTVIQACLKRSREDLELLIREGIANLRVCKGIYEESPEIAYKDADQIRKSFMDLLMMLLKSGNYVGIATHDKLLIDQSKEAITSCAVQKEAYEFQMLLGVTERLRAALIRQDHRMRIYVPFGQHWYGYSMRRLRENPRIAGYIIRNLFVRE
jgi:proline dehydrogenase